jgi:hypothetical protein
VTAQVDGTGGVVRSGDRTDGGVLCGAHHGPRIEAVLLPEFRQLSRDLAGTVELSRLDAEEYFDLPGVGQAECPLGEGQLGTTVLDPAELFLRCAQITVERVGQCAMGVQPR